MKVADVSPFGIINIVSVLPFALFVGTISMEEIGLSLRVATHAYHTLPMAKYSLP